MAKGAVNFKIFAYGKIKENIINCTYAPGTILNEQFLCDELNISRTPIREALNSLHQEGFIQIISKKGIFIKNITIDDMLQIYQARLVLEPFVIKNSGPYLNKEKLIYFKKQFGDDSEVNQEMDTVMCQLNTDHAFHSYLASQCNNKYVMQIVNKILDENKRVMISTRNKGRVDIANKEHLQIIDFLLKDDYENSSIEMKNHIISCRDSAFSYYMNKGEMVPTTV